MGKGLQVELTFISQGWAGTALFNKSVRAQLEAFRWRQDTFSLGVCNGCQLMALLNWVGPAASKQEEAEASDSLTADGPIVHPTLFTHNTSGEVWGK